MRFLRWAITAVAGIETMVWLIRAFAREIQGPRDEIFTCALIAAIWTAALAAAIHGLQKADKEKQSWPSQLRKR